MNLCCTESKTGELTRKLFRLLFFFPNKEIGGKIGNEQKMKAQGCSERPSQSYFHAGEALGSRIINIRWVHLNETAASLLPELNKLA